MSNWHAQRRFLVTGGAGFVGPHVISRLAAHGATQVDVVRSREHDLRTADGCAAALARFAPAVVIHLAVSGGDAPSVGPATTLRDDLLMSLHLVEACRQSGVEKLVAVGTPASYPRDCPVPIIEADLFEGRPDPADAPRGLARRSLTALLAAERHEHGLASVFLVPADLYGPGDRFLEDSPRLVGWLIRRFVEARESAAEELVLPGDGSATRELLHVRDFAEMVCRAAERVTEPAPLNLASGEEVALATLVRRLRKLTRYEGTITWDTTQAFGPQRRALDGSRAESLLDYRAEVSLEEGLTETLAWYEASRAIGATPPQATQAAGASGSETSTD